LSPIKVLANRQKCFPSELFAEKMMLKKILAALGIGGAVVTASADDSPKGPYKDDAANFIYQLLFCDDLAIFETHHSGERAEPWVTLFSKPANLDEVAKIADDEKTESRVRMLAYNLLREAKKDVRPKKLLGTIIEVRLPEGLDTLAVFADGGARYINHSGKMAIVEGETELFAKEIEAVLSASGPIVNAIGPWDKPRLPAPQKGNIRMTFLVSDGLYFGEGPMEAMQQDPMAAPLIQAATSLLLKIVDKTTDSEQDGGGQPATRPESK
jgi:hypothetical protein